MKRSEINAWTAALRSGDYKQGELRLVREHHCGQRSFCCLGVLCELDPEVEGNVLRQSFTFNNETEQCLLMSSLVSAKHFRSSDAQFSIRTLEKLKTLERICVTHDLLDFVLKNFNRFEDEVSSFSRTTVNLANLNDAGLPFAGIAEIIEAFDKEIFSHIEEDVK